MAKTTAEKIAERDERIAQLQNEKKKLLQKQKADERKVRTNRLCRRHGLLEKYMPDLITITDEQFEMFIKRAIATSYGRDALAEIVTTAGAITKPQPTQTAAQSTATPTTKPPNTTHTNSTGGNPNPPKAEQSRA